MLQLVVLSFEAGDDVLHDLQLGRVLLQLVDELLDGGQLEGGLLLLRLGFFLEGSHGLQHFIVLVLVLVE